MQRTRKILIDNTNGVIYSNVTTTANATIDSVIAARIAKGMQIEVAPPGVLIQPVVATKYWRSQSKVLITDLTLAVRGKSSDEDPRTEGDAIAVRLRVTDTYGLNPTIYGPYLLSPGGYTMDFKPNISMLEDQRIYMDVIAVGSISPGKGLIGLFQFYQGLSQ